MIVIKDLFNTENLIAVHRYFTKVMPEAEKLLKEIAESMPEDPKTARFKNEKSDSICRMDDLRCSCILALAGGKDYMDIVVFIVSLHALCHFLNRTLETFELTDIGTIQQLYLPLSDSINPDISIGSNYECFANKETAAYLKRLSNVCRKKIAALPSYRMVAGKMKKYIKLYIELQSCKYQPSKIRHEHLRMWSDYYIRQFPGISFWEFSASADSLLEICAMFVSATGSTLTEEDVNRLDNAYMPWICAFQKLLHYYVNAREDIMTGRLNFTDFYGNLKQCEERLKFFSTKSLESRITLPDSGFHTALVKALPVIYLSDPRACFGLNRLASRRIMNDCSPAARTFWNCSRLLNSFK